MANRWMIFGILCLGIAVLVIFLERRKEKRLVDSLRKMLDEAIEGNFTESVFDETKYSALESAMAQYLSSSWTSARNVAEDKKKIEMLIGDISHQTKTPISNLLLYADLMAELELDTEAREYLTLIRAQSEKLSFLMASLIKLSRLESGILVLHPVRQGIKCMVEEVTAFYLVRAESKGLSLVMEKASSEEWGVQAIFDEKWTGEALGNLLDNAVKYTDSGSITVRVKPYEMFTCIEVEDTGCGIPEEEQAKIFSRFYRSGEVASAEGVGIGLALAREILFQEGGYIKVSSAVGKGSRFGLFLPNLSKK